MTSARTRHFDGPVIDDTTGSVTAADSRGELPTEPIARVGSGRRHLDKRRQRRTMTQRRAAQRTPGARHSAPRHAAARPIPTRQIPARQIPAQQIPVGHPGPARDSAELRTHDSGTPDRRVPDRTTRRVAAVLVALTLGYGVTVGVLLSPRSGTIWNAARQIGLAPAAAGGSLVAAGPEDLGTDGPAAPVLGPAVPARIPGGPAPLPAEVAPTPVGLSIPAIGVDEPTLIPLGRNPDGTMQVPDDFARAGWFTGGPTPGTAGPAVVAGHVDSRSGPAVFFRLRQLKAGDVVTVRLDNGRQARFVVDGVALYSKDDFPTETVFGAVPGVALRLITCGGSFDRVARSYRSNVVVYASQQQPSS